MLAFGKRKLTVDQFLAEYAGAQGKYELVDGEVWAMAGGSATHADIAGNVFFALKQKLRGNSCRPFNSDMGLELDRGNLRYPDVAIYCDPRDFDQDLREVQVFRHPSVIFEVLSPSTVREDRGAKVFEYKRLPSVTMIVLIDPVSQSVETHDRINDHEWRHRQLLREADLVLSEPAVTLTFGEIFDIG